MKDSYTDGFFNVSKKNGFLPKRQPLSRLPEKYNSIQNIIDNIPEIVKGNKDFNSYLTFLHNLNTLVKNETDEFLIQALYRAYSFITATYVLLPSHREIMSSGNYGEALGRVPDYLSIPLHTLAEKLNVFPWLEYHYGYGLGNYHTKDGTDNMEWDNLDASCKFTGSSDETGFILSHVYINVRSNDLVGNIFDVLNTDNFSKLKELYEVMVDMNKRRQIMWKVSNYKNYTHFRTFIMGIKDNKDIFPNGLVFEGVSEDPIEYRGETGAQDDIIPTCDIFSGVTKYYPENKLTDYLMDLRKYRPKCVQAFFKDLEEECKESVFEKLKKANDYENMVYLLAFVNEIYNFRSGHWQFVLKYIMKNTKYSKATGGTPITTWLPNQIEACLLYEQELIKYIGDNNDSKLYNDIKNSFTMKVDILNNQMAEISKNDFNIDIVCKINNDLCDKDFV